jgi:hypothetical protein
MTEEQKYQQPRQMQEKQEKEEKDGRQRREKREKDEEKHEKNWEEKWRRDPLNAAVWALIIIWFGVVLLANSLNLLNWVPFFEPLAISFLGAGVLLLLEAGIRLIMPEYRQPVWGNLILGVVFLAIGLINVISWECILPLVVIGVGLWLLFSGLLRRRQ